MTACIECKGGWYPNAGKSACVQCAAGDYRSFYDKRSVDCGIPLIAPVCNFTFPRAARDGRFLTETVCGNPIPSLQG